ncbi:MAG: MBL fold metallo-hydrolase [Parachlamydiaceae bacterium]
MILHTITTPGLSINTYLLIDPVTRQAAVIDPTRDLDSLFAIIAQEQCSLFAILETHVHADFVSGSKELKAQLNEIPQIYCSSLGGQEWLPSYCDIAVQNHQEISLGSLTLQAWHTPGHTPEHIMWVVFEGTPDPQKAKMAFTGDFLFCGSIGRPDLLGAKKAEKQAEALYESIFSVLPQLPDSLNIYPAHGAGSLCGKSIQKQASSTLEIERSTNPFLKYLPQAEWIHKALEGLPKIPYYFTRIKQINVIGAPLIQELPIPLELNSDEIIASIYQGVLAIDIRNIEDFALAHPTGALNFALEGFFIQWASNLLPQDETLILIAENETYLKKALNTMRLIGFDNVRATYIWNPKELNAIQGAIESFPFISNQKVLKMLNQTSEKKIKILDVRSLPEWQLGHIEGAIHIEIQKIPSSLADLPQDCTWGIVCGSGYRASIVASQLQNAGFSSVFNIQGGMNDWIKNGLKIVHE